MEARVQALNAEVTWLRTQAPADRDYVERSVKALFERVEMLRRAGEIAEKD